MKITILTIALLFFAVSAHAVPVLQVGAPGATAGTYAPYVAGTNPTEADTAFTSGGLIYVGGVYQQKSVLQLGGAYAGGTYTETTNGGNPVMSSIPINSGGGWASLGYAPFEGKGAVLVVSVPNGTVAANGSLSGGTAFSIIVDGGASLTPFLGSQDNSYFPNNHAPVTDPHGSALADYLFFDLGNIFSRNAVNGNAIDPTGPMSVPNFDGTQNDSKYGNILDLTLDIAGIDWAHFDVMAIETSLDFMALSDGSQTPKIKNAVYYSVAADDKNNPGSHDVTWKKDEGGGGGGTPVPEPGTLILVGVGLAGLAMYRRKM